MMSQPEIDPKKVEEFAGKALGDVSGAFTTLLCSLGDRLGLFRDLATHGPTTARELAQRAEIHERYAREWLGAMATAGYLQYDPPSARFALPPEHVPVLAQEGGQHFFGGVYQMMPSILAPIDRLKEAFREGGGVPQSAYDDDFWAGMERFTAGWFENLLIQEWIPALPDVKAKLERGATVADVGCGSGRAVIRLARSFPKSRYIGFDVFEKQVVRATRNAKAAGVDDRVRFEGRDVSKGFPDTYDVITTFDVIHDAVNPRGILHAIRKAVKPDGRYVCLDINCSDRLEENLGPLGALFHGFSIFYCMTTSLANRGEGLGTLGLPESRLREFCREAGFQEVRRVPLENPFNNLYEVMP